jgi:hypothetical protein
MPLYRGTRYALLVAGTVISAPVLAWDEEEGDATPDLVVTFDATVEAGDVVRLQYDDEAIFAAPTDTTEVLEAADVAARQVAVALGELANVAARQVAVALGELANGTCFARARIERGSAGPSSWSNVEVITIAA